MSTVIGKNFSINAELRGEEDLAVFGRIEGSIELASSLNVEEGAIIKADIAAENAVIGGLVIGNITANDSIELGPGARVLGDLSAPRIVIAEGAMFKGRIEMTGADIGEEAFESGSFVSAGESPSPAGAVFSGRQKDAQPAKKRFAVKTKASPSRPKSPTKQYREEVEVKAVSRKTKSVKAKASPPKPPPSSGKKKKVRATKRR